MWCTKIYEPEVEIYEAKCISYLSEFNLAAWTFSFVFFPGAVYVVWFKM